MKLKLWLAEAYEGNKDTERALENYKKAYEIAKKTSYGNIENYRKKIEELAKRY